VYGGHRMEHRSTEYREEYEQNKVEQNTPLLISTEVNKKILLKTKRLNNSNKKKTRSFRIMKLVNKHKKIITNGGGRNAELGA
jgi:hypothetical protein